MSDIAQMVADELAIRTVIAKLSDSIIRRDPVTHGECYAEDGEWHAFGSITKGRDAIVALWLEVMAGFPFVFQTVSSIIVEIDGDRAASRGYVNEVLRMPDGSSAMVLGIYHHTFKKDAGVWRLHVNRYDQIYFGSPAYDGRFFPLLDYGAPPHDPDPARMTKPIDLSAPSESGDA